jgi:hypothetical protein
MDGYVMRIYLDNGIEVSAICHRGSYGGDQGLIELAAFRKDGTYIRLRETDEVIGYLTAADAWKYVHRIKAGWPGFEKKDYDSDEE